jgi:hypothetical protein
MARWREFNPTVEGEAQQAGLALRPRLGGVVAERAAVFVEAHATAPFVVPLHGLSIAGVGIGATWFTQPAGPWHVDLAARRAWANRSMFARQLILRIPPPIESIDEIWMLEAGIGRKNRAGRWDRGWTGSVFGALLKPEGSSGWAAGGSLTYCW